ncbi:hypothetical protein BDY24DRAFT_373329 [Mrakia frigida]|uniref:uncharacterized protein n=1 Tax=Mrakia frigida TaxID=29902 RepID=UPI003FCC1BFB
MFPVLRNAVASSSRLPPASILLQARSNHYDASGRLAGISQRPGLPTTLFVSFFSFPSFRPPFASSSPSRYFSTLDLILSSLNCSNFGISGCSALAFAFDVQRARRKGKKRADLSLPSFSLSLPQTARQSPRLLRRESHPISVRSTWSPHQRYLHSYAQERIREAEAQESKVRFHGGRDRGGYEEGYHDRELDSL